MLKIKYDVVLLKKFQAETGLVLTTATPTRINRDTVIEGYCVECKTETFSRGFRLMLHHGGMLCKKCATIQCVKKRKTTCLEKYGAENAMQSQAVRDKAKATCVEKYGVEHAMQSQAVRDKAKATCVEKYGVEYPHLLQEVRDKVKATCINKYGVENVFESQEIKDKIKAAFQSQEIRDKIKATCLERYGVEHAFQSQEIRDKIKATCLERYKVEHVSQSQEIKDRVKATCLERYKVEHASQSQEIKNRVKATCLAKYGAENATQTQEIRDKMKATCLERYGVEHPMQNSEIFERQMHSSFSWKPFVYPSGFEVKCQGYEPFALQELVDIFELTENDIVTSRSEVPEIWYVDNEQKTRRYYVDIYIPMFHLCIEVKSEWTICQPNVLEKHIALKQSGYVSEIWVYDNDGNKLYIVD
jgi:hypothetical protein